MRKDDERKPWNTVIGWIFVNFTVFYFPMAMPFIYLYALIYRPPILLTFCVALFTYQTFLAKRWDVYKNLLKSFDLDKWFKEYSLVFEEEYEDKNVLIVTHPHSIFTYGLTLNYF